MEFCMITFRSVTPAQRAESLLRRVGFACSIRRTPRWMEEQGCGYSLRVKTRDVAQCIKILRGNSVPFRKVYLHTEEGAVEELSL